jgi:signal transduction histidine kinase
VADIAELDTGTHRLSPTEVRLPQLVDDAVDLALLRKGHEVVFELDVDDLTVVADADRVAAALTNLLANARKFAPEGSTVRVRTELRDADGIIVIHVEDEGPGVPADRVGVIFRKFGRVDHRRPGSGLGLYLARGVVRAHGGELSYRRGATGGAHFVLELPIGRPADDFED